MGSYVGATDGCNVYYDGNELRCRWYASTPTKVEGVTEWRTPRAICNREERRPEIREAWRGAF